MTNAEREIEKAMATLKFREKELADERAWILRQIFYIALGKDDLAERVRSRSRRPELVDARKRAARQLRDLGGATWHEIGAFLNRTHTGARMLAGETK